MNTQPQDLIAMPLNPMQQLKELRVWECRMPDVMGTVLIWAVVIVPGHGYCGDSILWSSFFSFLKLRLTAGCALDLNVPMRPLTCCHRLLPLKSLD